jgi:long-subunit fatty acid transport protein
MKNIRLILVTLMLVTALYSVFADDNSAAAYTRIGIDARSIGMGGTGAAFLDNVTSTYINPAVLADVKRHEFASATRQNMEEDKNQHAAALGFRLPFGYVALSWQTAGVSGFEGYTPDGTYTGDFDVSDNNIGISYAVNYGRLNFGVTPKIYMSKIDDESKTGYGVDAGLLYHVNRYFNFGFVARDVISDYDGDGTEVSRAYIPSIAAFPIPGMTIAADLIGISDFEEPELRLGVEYWIGVGDEQDMGSSLSGIRVREGTTWSNIFSRTQAGIRAGVNNGAFACGFGLRYQMLELNYAYQVAQEKFMNDNHVYSLVLRF